MLLAHTSAGGVHIEWLLFAGALLVLGVVFFLQKATKPVVSLVLVVLAFVVGTGAFVLTGDEGGTRTIDASVEITEPSDGAIVPVDEVVTVNFAVEGATLGEEVHVHIYLDDEVIAMPTEDSVEILIEEPGEHELTAELSDSEHRAFEPSIADTVTVTAE